MIEGANARLIGSPGFDRDALARLQRARVAIIGLGVLGGQVSYHLGLLGVGQLLIDCGRVDPENLGNQGFPVGALGEPKCVARARQIRALNPDCAVETRACRVEDLGLAALAAVDLVVTGLDSRASRARVNEMAWRWGLPWVDAAVDGTGRMLRGTVSVYDPRQTVSPCYLCPLNAADLAAIGHEGRGPGCPNPLRPDVPVTPPTLQASAFGALVAAVQALWVTRMLLGRGADLVGHQLVVEADATPRTRLLTLERNRRCLFDHQTLPPPKLAPGETVGDLLAAASADLGTVPEELLFHGRTLITGLACSTCGSTRDVVRVAGTFGDEEVRCRCRPGAEMAPAGASESLRRADAERLACATWNDLGIPCAEVVTARTKDAAAHYVVNQPGGDEAWQARHEALAGGANERPGV